MSCSDIILLLIILTVFYRNRIIMVECWHMRMWKESRSRFTMRLRLRARERESRTSIRILSWVSWILNFLVQPSTSLNLANSKDNISILIISKSFYPKMSSATNGDKSSSAKNIQTLIKNSSKPSLSSSNKSTLGTDRKKTNAPYSSSCQDYIK